MELISFMFMAFFVEGLVDFVKQIVDADKSIKYAYILSIVLGVATCCIFNLNLLSLLDINTTVPFAGNIVSGFIIARGSNYLNDVISKFLTKENNLG